MKAIIIRYSEIHLKGNNKEYFESALISNLKTALKGFDLQFGRSNARYVLRNFDESLTPQIIDCVKNVFGVHSLSVAEEVPSTLEDIRAAAIALAPKRGSFKVSTNRADKRFPLHSMDLSAEIGGDVLENNSALTVNLHNPDHVINIDIRETAKPSSSAT